MNNKTLIEEQIKLLNEKLKELKDHLYTIEGKPELHRLSMLATDALSLSERIIGLTACLNEIN